MTGFEYSFAGLLLSRGFIDEGLKVIRAVRQRYDGEKRNPWNEMECGSNYARTMSTFAFLPILSGFYYDIPNKTVGFNPKINKDNFKCPWFLESGWGEFIIDGNKAIINVLSGYININTVYLPFISKVNSVTANGKDIDYEFADGKLVLKENKYAKIEVCYE